MVDTKFFGSAGEFKLSDLLELAEISDANLSSQDASKLIENAQVLDVAKSGDISLAAHKSYTKALSSTNAGVVLVSAALADQVPTGSVAVICNEPHISYVKILKILFPAKRHRLAIFPIIPDAAEPIIESGVSIANGATIGSEAQIGQGTIIGPGAVIGPNVTIGRNCVIGANAIIECSLIGDNVLIAGGTVIGCDGFGLLDFGKSNVKIPQLGRTIIQSNVEIGSNCTIDRGALDDTIIGENSKIGGLVQIGHGSKIGRNCLIAPMAGLAGATILEDSVLMGANVGTVGHITMGEGSIAHPRASITKDWPAGSKIAGSPAQDIKDLWREYAAVRRLAKGKKK
ncbi:MAG: UDP-3-O-(3-hydroxymyristoyl)glucosamine N-acyltransferase [Devosiaceae bacterium]|nr:UDP-3-O-(3-hydroxymyristoyl)glucosamine N-acyltransferase [Devosiaceae bacterium]